MRQAFVTAAASVRDYRLVFLAYKFIEKKIGGIFGAIPRVATIKMRCGKLLLVPLETEH